MVFIDRMKVFPPRPAPQNKVIKGKDFWAFNRARQVLAAANVEKKRIIESALNAFEEEKKRGYREGQESAKFEQSANMIAIVSQTVDYFSKVESQMVDLVLEAVQKIVSDFDDREKVVKVVKNSLSLVRNQKLITVIVHPSQNESIKNKVNELKDSFPSIEHIDVTSDPAICIDACIIESEIGRVEASMSSQIEALRSTLERVFGAGEKESLPDDSTNKYIDSENPEDLILPTAEMQISES